MADITITVDFKQASEILAMFGGEPGEITLMLGDGHSGRGVYAHYSDYPEEGAEYLGVSDKEAMPVADAGEAAAAQSPIELRGVAETLKSQDGAWRSCSGCHELNEGHDTGPYSAVLKCHLGNGCNECGGIGAVWDTTDYADMAGHALAAAPVQQEAAGIADAVVQMVGEMDDRTSPEDWPEAMLVTGPELHGFILLAFERAALTPSVVESDAR